MLAALGRFSYRRRWWITALFVIALLAAAPFAPRVSERLTSGGYEFSGADSVLAGEVLEREFGLSAADILFVFSDPSRTVEHPEYQAALRATRDELLRLPLVEEVESALDARPELVSADGRTTLMTARTTSTPSEAQAQVEEFRVIAEASPIPVVLAGFPIVSVAIAEASERDLLRAEAITLPLVLVVLVLVFGAVVAAGIPLLLGFMSVVVAWAALYGLSLVMDLSVFVTNIATMLGLGIGIDYSLLMVSRFREELRGKPVDAAVEATVARAGKAIVFSGLAVIVGLFGLLTFEMAAIRSIGIGGITVMAFLMIGSLIWLPAVLAILGNRIDKLSLPFRRPAGQGRGWARLARFVMRHPGAILVATAALLLLLGSPFLRVRFGVPGADVLPPDAPARQGLELLQRHFQRGSLPSVIVTISDPRGAVRPANVSVIDEISTKLKAHREITSVTSLTSLLNTLGMGGARIEEHVRTDFAALPEALRARLGELSSPNTTLVLAETSGEPNSESLQQLVREIRAVSAPGREIHVGGEIAVFMDFVNAVYGHFPWAVALVLGVMYVVLLFLFASLVLPLKAVIMNALSITAAYGALVFVFQEGHLSELLRFQPQGFVEATIPVLMFFALFGLSMDYEVFLLSRIRESWQRTGDNTASVAEGLQRTGGIITGAAAIVIVVAAAFSTAELVILKALGVGTALAVLVDASIVRVLLVPSTMRLLGHLNWWAPGWLARLTRATASFSD